MFQQKKGNPSTNPPENQKKDRMLYITSNKVFGHFFFIAFFGQFHGKQKPTTPSKKTLKFHQPKQDPQVVDPPRPGLHHVVLRALRWVILGSLFLRDVGSHKVIGMFPKIRFFYTFYIHLFIGFGTINYKPSILGGFLPLFLERPIWMFGYSTFLCNIYIYSICLIRQTNEETYIFSNIRI